MYKKTTLLLVYLLIYNLTFACDLCSIYIGLNPNGTKNSLGIRHRYRAFEKDYFPQSTQLINGIGQRSASIKGIPNDKHGLDDDLDINEKFTLGETYNSYDVFANFYLNPRLQVNLSTYFADNNILNNDSVVANIAGIGDISVIVKYQLFNTKDNGETIKNKLLHRIILGGGINLPTGNFNKKYIADFEQEITPGAVIYKPVEELDPHIQAGTGAFSYLFLSEYLVKYNKFGFNGNISYKHNATNRNNFRFANRFNANGSLFFLTNVSKKVKMMPNIGGSYETSKRDQQDNQNFIGSGGRVLFLNSGINLFIDKLSVEFSYYHPVHEILLDDQPFNTKRIITQLAYYF